jgi:hypothetical protein
MKKIIVLFGARQCGATLKVKELIHNCEGEILLIYDNPYYISESDFRDKVHRYYSKYKSINSINLNHYDLVVLESLYNIDDGLYYNILRWMQEEDHTVVVDKMMPLHEQSKNKNRYYSDNVRLIEVKPKHLT